MVVIEVVASIVIAIVIVAVIDAWQQVGKRKY